MSRVVSKPVGSESKPIQLISTAQAAKRLGVHPNTVREFIANNQLKGYRVGRLIKLDATAIEAFITEIDNGS